MIQVQGYKCLCDCHHWARPMGCDVFLICCHATYHLAAALILIHLHQIWSSTLRPHLYSVVSKLASLDAVARINTRTHRGFKSARSHEKWDGHGEATTKTRKYIFGSRKSLSKFFKACHWCSFAKLATLLLTNIPLDPSPSWLRKLDSPSQPHPLGRKIISSNSALRHQDHRQSL